MTMRHESFAAFILTHGRPDNVKTYDTIRHHGYTGRIVLIIDTEDPHADGYRERFGPDNVVQFDKAKIAEEFDTADTQADRRTIVYARNYCFKLAREMGLTYFVELDDDYVDFQYRFIRDEDIHGVYVRRRGRGPGLDAVFDAMLDFLDDTGAVSVAMSQGGDHMGGYRGAIHKGVKRKAMNSMFHRTDRPIAYLGRINEDVNTYVLQGSRGDLFLTFMGLQLDQTATQQSKGGMSDVYLLSGTYVKSFYTVMMAPSCVKVGLMGRTAQTQRFHHKISWDLAVPKILSAEYRKPRTAAG